MWGGVGREQLVVGASNPNAHQLKLVNLPLVGFPAFPTLLLFFLEAGLVGWFEVAVEDVVAPPPEGGESADAKREPGGRGGSAVLGDLGLL